MNAQEQQILSITKAIEKQVDSTIEQIENLDVNDLEALRKNRMKQLKELENKKAEWLTIGHGSYEELPEEKAFFDVIKRSKNVAVHFYTNTSFRSRIVDKHLKILAPKHIETRFVYVNAEKCPFLAERLKIKTIPSIVLCQDSVMVDKIVGFTQLGNRDDFSTEMLEWRIAQNGIIDYEGDLQTPPDLQKIKLESSSAAAAGGGGAGNKRIRDGKYGRNEDDGDIEEFCKLDDDVKAVQSNVLTAEEEAELAELDA